ncbi:MAG TPA: hypothetical protein VMV45_07720 [Casimicrobiaceae bacterium]|nr:hypothetical protein [Casimicrobiaceae bacterium]
MAGNFKGLQRNFRRTTQRMRDSLERLRHDYEGGLLELRLQPIRVERTRPVAPPPMPLFRGWRH